MIVVHKDKLVLPWEERFSGLIPGTTKVSSAGRCFGVVPHGAAETKILRNLGFAVPSPILSQYAWANTIPFASQRETAALLSTEPRAYCLSSMGVGKTRSTLFAYDYLRSVGTATKMLVTAPLSTLVDVWEREIFEVFHHLRCVVLHGTKKQRLTALAQDAHIYIINHDGVDTILKELIEAGFSIVVVDELGAYRNAQTKRWKAMNALINQKHHPVVWGLTGSPTPNEPTDAYGQVKLLTPTQVPRSFRRFQQDTMSQVSQFRWIPKKEANEIVAKVMKPSIRFTLDECHDIPETTYSMRHVPPSATQKRLYDLVVDKFRAEYKGNQITAVNEGAKLMKLLQISAGFAYDAEHKGAYIDAKARLAEVVELVEQAEKKVLIFTSFKWMVRALNEVLSRFFTTAMITGDTPAKDRATIFSSFRRSATPHVIIAHAGTMAHGLTLVEANTIIWYGPTMSAELYEQANARIRRPGQTLHTHVICIESTPVEKTAFLRLQRKQKMQGMLLDMFVGSQGD